MTTWHFTAWMHWSHISKSPFIVFNLGSFQFFTIKNSTEMIRTSLVIKWLRICLPTSGMWVQSLVKELRCHMPQSNWRASALQWGKACRLHQRTRAAKTLKRKWPSIQTPLIISIGGSEVKWNRSSCLTLCNPMDCSLPGSSIHGIFQARVLEWVAISFSIL